MRLKHTDTLEFINRGLKVNGKSFLVEYPDEPILGIEKGKLVTIVFRGCGCSLTHWEPEDIEGHFPEQSNEDGRELETVINHYLLLSLGDR